MNKISAGISAAIISFVVWKQYPIIKNNFKSEGETLVPQEYLVYSVKSDETSVFFPSLGKKVIAIFWASYCGPCKVEMGRLQASIDSGKMKASQVFAINPFEGDLEIYKFLKDNKYSFQFLKGTELGNILDVEVTPTTLFIDSGKIISRSTGMSVVGIWRAENFVD